MSKSTSSLTSGDWDNLRRWAECETGMDLGGSRFRRLQDAVNKVHALQSARAELSDVLGSNDSRAKFLEQVTGELTVGETFFLRNEHHFRALRETVFPEIIRDNSDRREVRVWSAGCCTGEEPYSLAILLDDLLPDEAGWQVLALGTDLNPDFLARARAGCYRNWSFRQTSIQRDARYFQPVPDGFRICDRIRGRVRFSYLNLVKDVYPSPLNGTVGIDLILFRNVAIYLKPEVTSLILKRFQQCLRPGGWLLLGETELGVTAPDGFEVHRLDQATFYRRPVSDSSPFKYQKQGATSVLAEASRWTTSTTLPAPELPQWVPLPYSGSTQAGDAPPIADATRLAASPSIQKDWDGIVQSLSERNMDAVERLVDKIADRKERAAIRLRIARVLLEMAETATAHEQLAACSLDDPLLLDVYLIQASLAEEAGDLREADRVYRRALYLNRRCAMIHFHLALVQQQLGDDVGAFKSLSTTLNLTEGCDPHALAECGDGVCIGRLREMAQMLIEVTA